MATKKSNKTEGYRCTCPDDQTSLKEQRGSQLQYDEYDEDQKTFISCLIEIVSVIAFIFIGSLAFWVAVGGVLFQFFKRLYYSDRHVKLLVIGLFTFLLLSMTVRLLLNKRACRAQTDRVQGDVNIKVVSVDPPKPPPEYLIVTGKDKSKIKSNAGADGDKTVSKMLTLTIVNEKRKEVFKTSKVFFIPEAAMEMKKPPAILVYLKELLLDDY